MTLNVHIQYVDGIALIGFFGDDWLEIFGTGHFYFYHPSTTSTVSQLAQADSGFGSTALHPNTIGVSARGNDIVIQVVGTTYSFYANGQLLTSATMPLAEGSGAIALGAIHGQALFSDISIYTSR
jgi:hypothetical protein